MQTNTHKALCKLLKGDYRNESNLELIRRVEGLIASLRRERDDALQLLSSSTEFRGSLIDTAAHVIQERDALKRAIL